jgi:hypothetical protein
MVVMVGLWASAANADLITLTFDVDVLNQFDYATQTYNPGFQAFSSTLTVMFDDAVTIVEPDSSDTLIGFGAPLIYSPLTASLPYGPAMGQTLPSSEVALANRDYGASQQWSEFAIVQSEDSMSGANTWAYDFELDSGSLFPLIPNLVQDRTAQLRFTNNSRCTSKMMPRLPVMSSDTSSTLRRDKTLAELGMVPRHIS